MTYTKQMADQNREAAKLAEELLEQVWSPETETLDELGRLSGNAREQIIEIARQISQQVGLSHERALGQVGRVMAKARGEAMRKEK